MTVLCYTILLSLFHNLSLYSDDLSVINNNIIAKDVNVNNQTNNQPLIQNIAILDKIFNQSLSINDKDKYIVNFDFKKFNNNLNNVTLDTFNNIKIKNVMQANIIEDYEDIELIKRLFINDSNKIFNQNLDKAILDKAIENAVDNSVTKENVNDKDNIINNAIKTTKINLLSLLYLNSKEWSARINNMKITNKSDTKITDDIKIITVKKNYILFLILKPIDDIFLMKIKDLQKNNIMYSNNYFLVNNKNNDFLIFKLQTGESIDLDTILISRPNLSVQ